MPEVSLSLPGELAEAIEQIAEASDRPWRDVVIGALRDYVTDYAEAQEAMSRLQDDTDEVISAEELRRRLGR